MNPLELILPLATTLLQVQAPGSAVVPPAAPPPAPAVAVPQSSDSALPLTPGVPATPGALPPSATATSGRVVSLNEAQRNAIQNQPQIHQAKAATAAAVGRVWEARSGYLPQLTATAEYERTTLNTGLTSKAATTTTMMTGATMPSAPTSTPTSPWTFYNLLTAGISASQLIYDFGQTSERWRAANRATESLEWTEKATVNTVLLNVRTAFFMARADKALAAVAADTLANELKHLAQVMGNVSVGIAAEIDLATERTTVANDRLALIQAQNNYDTARVQLNVAMGVSSNSPYDVADDGLAPIEGEDESTEALAARGLASRPEIQSLEKEKQYGELTVRSLKGGYGPTLSAIGGLSLSDAFGGSGAALGSGGTELNTGAVPTAYVGALLVWPLFQGGLTAGQVREAEGNLGVTDAQLDQERLQVRLDVEQARLGVRTYKVAITTADEVLTNARYQLKLAEKRYAAGIGNIIELGDAQVAVTSASAQRVQADYNLATARAQLLAALGRL